MSKTLRIRLTQPWGDHVPGKELDAQRDLAMRLISAGVAKEVPAPIETATIEQAPEQTVQPRRRRGRPRRNQ